MQDRMPSRSMAVFHHMPRRALTLKTSCRVTVAIRSNVSRLLCAAAALTFAVPLGARAQSAPALASVLASRRAVTATLRIRQPRTNEFLGVVTGAALRGTFHSWRDAVNQRYDENTGVRLEATYRLGDREYIVNENGAVRELRGLLRARQVTEDFIESDAFVDQPQYDELAGLQQLPDGREVYAIVVSPPQGQTETLYLDRKTWMVDRVAYDDADGTATQDYYDYRMFAG